MACSEFGVGVVAPPFEAEAPHLIVELVLVPQRLASMLVVCEQGQARQAATAVA
jgi:hypothetical protein